MIDLCKQNSGNKCLLKNSRSFDYGIGSDGTWEAFWIDDEDSSQASAGDLAFF